MSDILNEIRKQRLRSFHSKIQKITDQNLIDHMLTGRPIYEIESPNPNQMISQEIQAGHKNQQIQCRMKKTKVADPYCLPVEASYQSVEGNYLKTYQVICDKGSADYGRIHAALHRSSGKTVITKCIAEKHYEALPECSWGSCRRKSDGLLSKIPLEIQLLCQMTNDPIVRTVEITRNNYYYQVVFETKDCCIDDTLERLMDQRMSQPMASHLFKELVLDVQELHQRGIIHQNIKPANVIIAKDLRVKLINFGYAAKIPPVGISADCSFVPFAGSLLYASPEVHGARQCQGTELDVWSLGVVLYRMVFHRLPFLTKEEILAYQDNVKLPLPTTVHQSLKDLLRGMLHPDRDMRLTIPQILRSKWVSPQ